jgi:hypothetical protein
MATMFQDSDEGPHCEALRQVARRYPGHPFVLDPVAVELVLAVLDNRLLTNERSRREAALQIAETLFEDPALHERLERLWLRLSTK